MLIDTHCHINSEELRHDMRNVIARARNNGVMKMMIAGCDYEDSCDAVSIATDFAQFGLYASVGIHPHEAKFYEKIPDEFYRLITHERVVAVGEMGLDYHYDHSPREIQKKVFELQLAFAQENNMPVILHIREAMKDALEILKNYKGLKMLFHCYSGGLEFLDEVLELDGMLAFGGALTWNGKMSEELREVIKQVPIEKILFETDCPYMAPVPFRGKINEPAYVKYVYETAAKDLNISLSELENKISENAGNFFGWENHTGTLLFDAVANVHEVNLNV